MLPVVLAGGLLWYSSSQQQPNTGETKYDLESREINHMGLIRSTNSTRGIWAEEVNIVRPSNGCHVPPLEHAIEQQRWQAKRNNALGKLYANAGIEENRGIIRNSFGAKPPLVMLPNHEAFSQFDSLPNAYYDRESAAMPADNRSDLYRDPFGHNNSTPAGEYTYMYPNILYWGNPWGTGGPKFQAVGNQYRNTDFETFKEKPLPLVDGGGHEARKRRVRFNLSKKYGQ